MIRKPITIIVSLFALLLLIVVLLPQFQSLLGARGIIHPSPGTTMTVPATGYAPSPYQTDSTPCITAAGTRVRLGTVATNFLPMGTLVEINNETYIVEDRTNPRYYNTVDIFFPSTKEALEFGKQKIAVTILDYGQPGQALPPAAGPAHRSFSEGGETSEAVGTDNSTTLFDKLRGQLHHLRHFIKAGLPADVNRYDVDCL